jgi:hypothetical protein
LKFQAKLTFYRPNQLNTPLFDIYNTICVYHWQAEESAFVCALTYFDEVLGWTIGDFNYLPYLHKRVGGAWICNMHGCTLYPFLIDLNLHYCKNLRPKVLMYELALL